MTRVENKRHYALRKYPADSKPTSLGHPLKRLVRQLLFGLSAMEKVTHCHGMSFSKGLSGFSIEARVYRMTRAYRHGCNVHAK